MDTTRIETAHMTDHDTNENGCTLCELPVEGSAIVDDGDAFCCVGCREVYNALETVENSC